MKLFIVLSVVALSRADLFNFAGPIHKEQQSLLQKEHAFIENLEKELANAFLHGKREFGDPLPTKIQELIEKLKPFLNNNLIVRRDIFSKIKDSLQKAGEAIVKAGKDAAPTLLEITKELAPTLLEVGLTAVGKRNEKTDEVIQTIGEVLHGGVEFVEALENSGIFEMFGKRDVDDSGLVANVKTEMLAFLDKIKDSVEGAENIATNLEAKLKAAEQGLKDGQDIKELAQMVLSTMEKGVGAMVQKGTFDVDINKLVDQIVPTAVSKLFSKHSRRGLIGDLFNGLTDTFKDTVGLLSGTAFGDLKTFLGNIVSTATTQLTPTIGNLKNLAEAFLTNAGQATAQVAAQAVKFFQPFQDQLGGLFTQIKNVAATLTGQHTV